MVDVDAGQIAEHRRADADTPAAVVLTVDAVVLLVVVVVGLPFLAFFFSDEEIAGWQGLGPYVAGWIAAAVLGGAAAAAAVRFAGFGTYDARRVGFAAAAGVAVVSGTVLAASFEDSPAVALAAAAFAATNVAAALALLRPERAGALVAAMGFGRAEPVVVEDDWDDVETESDRLGAAEAEIEAAAERNKPTVDLQVRPAETNRPARTNLPALANRLAPESRPALTSRLAPMRPKVKITTNHPGRRGPQAQAALRTLQGVRLPSRALRR